MTTSRQWRCWVWSARIAVLSLLGTVVGLAQSFETRDRSEPSGGIPRLEVPDRLGLGFEIESLRLWSGASSNVVPLNAGLGSLAGAPDFGGPGIEYGGDLTVAWRKTAPRGGMSLMYQPSFVGRSQFSEWNSLNHFLVIDGTRRMTRKVDLDFSSTASLFGFEQFFFDPPILRSVAAPPDTFEDLVAGVEGGAFSDEEIASVLTGSPIVESPGGSDLSLTRTLSVGVSAGAQYRKSPRLSLGLGVSANEFRFVSGRQAGGADDERAFFAGGRTLGVNADVAYQTSRRTIVGGTVVASRIDNGFIGTVDYVSTIGRVSRRLRRAWRAGAQIGAGTARIASGLDGASGTWLAGADVARNGRQHAFQLSVQKNVGDPYSLGAQVSVAAGASWEWILPGRQWSSDIGFDRSRSRIAGLSDVTMSVYRAALTRRLNRHTAARAEYSYGSYSSDIIGLFGNLNRHRMILALLLRPTGGIR